MAGADEHMIATELAGRGRHPALLHRARQRAGDEGHAQRFRQIAGDGGQRLARIDLQIVQAAARAMVRQAAVVQRRPRGPTAARRDSLPAADACRRTPAARRPHPLRASTSAPLARMKARLGGQVQPQLARLLRMRQHHAGRLAGHDHLAEIADRGAVRLAAALDHGHRQPRLAAAQACAMPSMPAPTTITSKFMREPRSATRFPRGAVTDRQSRFRAAPGKRFNATKNGR